MPDLLISGSWDASLKVWDPFSPTGNYLLRTLRLPGKVFAMDVTPVYIRGVIGVQLKDDTPRLVVAMANRAVWVYNLRTMRHAIDSGAPDSALAPEQKRESSLKFMLRDVRCRPDGLGALHCTARLTAGYATSSVEGRIAVEFFDASPAAQAQKYAFKCHRKDVDGMDVVYPIHAMAFHPIYGTFASAGGDAHCSLWDPTAKKRIRQYVLPSPLSAVAFSAMGDIMVIASGAENIEDTQHDGEGAGEVGDVGRGGAGNVRIHVKHAMEDARPKVKTR